MKTCHVNQFRTLIALFQDMNELFSVNFDKADMCLLAMDAQRQTLIHITFNSELYQCREPLQTKVDVTALYNLITDSAEEIEMTITDDSPDVLGIKINQGDVHYLHLQRRNMIKIPVACKYTTVFNVDTTVLQSIISQLTVREDDNVMIEYKNDRLLFFSANTTLGWSSTGRKGAEDIDAQYYNSAHLKRFVEMLQGDVCEIFLKKDNPLVLRYHLPMAIVRFVIVPTVFIE